MKGLDRRAFLVSTAATLAGCGASLKRFPFDHHREAQNGPGLDVVFFGVACFVLQWRGTAVLIDPFFTTIPVFKTGFGLAESDPAQVDPHLPLLTDVESVLVCHAHYDHVLDLPYVAEHLRPHTTVFGSRTLRHTLAPLNLPLAFHTVNGTAATPTSAGQWLAANGGRVRVLPIASGHPNNYAFIHMWTDRLTTDRTEAPTRASHFQEGETFAFLLDFLDDDGETIVHRVYVQTSSRGVPDGLFPAHIRDEHPIDVALLAMDCAIIKARGRDSIIDFLDPKTVLFCHWENFFRSKDKPPREGVKVNLPAMRRFFHDSPEREYLFPGWNARFQFSDNPRPSDQ